MCGIAGVFAFSEKGLEAHRQLAAASAVLAHRGPDAAGLFVKGRVGLASRRLAIIGTGKESDQPMTDSTGRFTIVYNGEVFNYKALRKDLQAAGIDFRTDSDTEVVLQLFKKEGTDCLKRMRGFFSFAIYDAAEEVLFLARDRYGEKPLYYYKDADRFLFGSELGALITLGVPREVDLTSLYQYLQLTYVPAPASMLQGVKKLLPGHALQVRAGRVQEQVWFRSPLGGDLTTQKSLPYAQQQVKLQRLLEQAVQQRMTADVPVGAFLSGGLDSSVVVALAAKLNPQLQTFSLGFTDSPYFDETQYARLVAKKLATNHTEVRLSTQQLQEYLLPMLRSLSEPFADSSALAVYALSQAASQQVKVVLSGDGADELFGGYNKHLAEHRVLEAGLGATAVTALDFLWSRLPSSRNSFMANKVRQFHRFAAGARLSAQERYWLWATWQTEAEALALLSERNRLEASGRLYRARKGRLTACLDNASPDLNKVLCADTHLVLGNDMLVKIDLMGMANGIEIRSPFLDHKVVKFAGALPAASKVAGTVQKKILRETFRQQLPEELFKRPKKGFEVPLSALWQGDTMALLQELVSDEFIADQGIFDLHQLRQLKRQVATGGSHAATRFWAVVVFQFWYRKWILNEPSPL
ncbi:asparagine synthase (glutamine-hydrolyzing) [Pontibacter qinzhouensis]|uniref:asparagine synthase (glutamine-hydrolyzing) n=1 Tax=Pontibacter qinzhouensis TaxID=2603253 RepID=A0A5C8J0T4_9BACT|nr:asparagine synthase (glutamine-hydrolyzing) [Pontibacter qinzhouensis]TXK27406.1 asparagine synthase (glutamine-hydrolyzing) [Pontibacter qinzhouensis]